MIPHTVRETHYLIVDTSRFTGLEDLLVSGCKLGIPDVVHNGVVEQNRGLRDYSDLGTEAGVVLVTTDPGRSY